MKKTKSRLLITFTVFVVVLSFFVPSLIFKYQDKLTQSNVEKVSTDIVNMSDLDKLTLYEKLNIIGQNGQTIKINDIDETVKDEVLKNAVSELCRLFALSYNEIYPNIYEVSATENVVFGSDVSEYTAIWEISFSFDNIYCYMKTDYDTGIILQLMIHTRTDYYDDEMFEVYYQYGVFDYNDISDVAIRYCNYLDLEFDSITDDSEEIPPEEYGESSFMGSKTVHIHMTDESDNSEYTVTVDGFLSDMSYNEIHINMY